MGDNNDLVPPPGLEGAVPRRGADGNIHWVAPAAAARVPEPVFAPGSLAPDVGQAAPPVDAGPAFAPGSLAPDVATPPPDSRLAAIVAPGIPVMRAPTPARTDVQRGLDSDDRATRRAAGLEGAPPAAQPGSGLDVAGLAAAYVGGDDAAGRQIIIAASGGDPDAIRVANQLNMLNEAGAIPQRRGGSGGPRTTRTATTTQTQLARDPTEGEREALAQAQAQADDADRRYVDGLSRQYEADARALTEGAERMQRAETDLQALRDRQERARAAQNAEIERRGRELDGVMRQVEAQQIDPGRLFARGNTRNRGMAALALIFGGLGDAITGSSAGTDAAMGIINRSVDADIDAQAKSLAAQRQGVGARRTLMQDMRAKLGSDDAARAAVRAAMLQDVGRQVRALRSQAQGEGRQAQLDQLLAQLDAQKAEALRASRLSGIGTTEIVTEQRQRRGGGGRARPTLNFGAVVPETTEVDSTERERLADRITDAEQGIEVIDQALGLIGSAPVGPISSWLMNSRSGRELDRALTQAALPAVKEAFGAANPDQVEMMQESLGFTRESTPEELSAALVRERNRLMQRAQAAHLSVGEGAVEEVQRRTPGVRRDVALREGRAEDIAPGFRRED